MNKVLTIAVSTVLKNKEKLISYLLDIEDKVPDTVQFLIISQLELEDETLDVSCSIKVIKCTEVGLSKSRNIAIRRCATKWLWFQDDDIKIIIESLPEVIESCLKFTGSLVLGKVLSTENHRDYFKDYSRYDVAPHFLAFRVSSIEIIARVDFLRVNNVWFDENLGLGADLTSCEENLFFYDLVCRNNARYLLLNFPICLHTTNNDTREINFIARYKARGYLLAKIHSLFSLFILIWWSIRSTNDKVKRVQRLLLMLKGAILAFQDQTKQR